MERDIDFKFIFKFKCLISKIDFLESLVSDNAICFFQINSILEAKYFHFF